MEEAVTKQHAHPNTVFHCLYGYYCLGYTRKALAEIYNKGPTTISNWIYIYEETGTLSRLQLATTPLGTGSGSASPTPCSH
ncbi:hypothetical protein PR001_g11353 [Phytophthora rubi]|uniref:HTH psq-type domain-containing protein n=1 Tax=Phytophthora rubi TaxID=129364 RepID=A0A6A3MPZ6_9STRA|nr:hypothetical protein PR001_g11353 [Phytophthora rubi]